MADLSSFYSSLGPVVPFLPLVIVGLSIAFTLRMSKYKWAVHFIALAATLAAPFAYLWVGGIIDPTTIEYPGIGEGFLFPLYGMTAVPVMIGYAQFTFLTRTASQASLGSTA